MLLISELRRRQVFQTAAWYGGLAWFAVEAADTVFPRFGLSDAWVRAVIVLALCGLPIALALAWWFDLTAFGLKREAAAPTVPDAGGTAATSRGASLWRLPSFWIALALGAGLALSAQQAWQRLIRPGFEERPGLAVLPFANLSPDPANAYFADGLHEEILATLARAGGLRVISRTSVLRYRNAERSVRDIARELDASLVLEGSVRRDGDELRLTLELIDARNDAQVWAETYDRKFERALDLQQEVAQRVVAAIGAKLSPTEERLIASSSTRVPEAYAFYLNALSRWRQIPTADDYRTEAGLLDRTIELDPQFGLAYALRAKVRVFLSIYLQGDQRTAIADQARADVERALELAPDLPEALTARAMYTTYVDLDPARAMPDLERALELAPNDAEAHILAGLTQRRLGHFDTAIEHLRAATRLEPGEKYIYVRLVYTLYDLGRYAEAERALDELSAHSISPEATLIKYALRFGASGETRGWRDEYERLAPEMPLEIRSYWARLLLLATGDLAAWLDYLQRVDRSDSVASHDRTLELAMAHLLVGQRDEALPYLTQIAERPAGRAEDIQDLATRGQALELLGRHEDAIRTADAAVARLTRSRDAINGPQIELTRAWVLIHAGGERAEEGYQQFEQLLGDFALQPRIVAIEPMVRLLEHDERLRKIIARAIAALPATQPTRP